MSPDESTTTRRRKARSAAISPPRQTPPDPALTAAVERLRRGDAAGAATALQAIVARDPRHALAWCNLGIALMQLARWKEAGKAMRTYVQLEPQDAMGHVRLSVIQNALHAPEAALKSLQNALRWDPSCAAAYRYLGEIYLQQGKLDEARDGFKWALRLRPQDVASLCGLGEIYERKGMPGMAARVYQDGIARVAAGEAGPLYRRLGRLLAAAERWRDAADAYERAVEQGADSEDVVFEYGVAAWRAGLGDVARGQLRVLESMGSALAERLRPMLQP